MIHPDRPQVPGAIVGCQLGEAAHRLVKNTLNIKLNNTSHGLLGQPLGGHHIMNRFGSPEPSGYGKYYGKNTNYYGQYNQQDIMIRPRYPSSSNGGQNDRQNFRIQDRSQHQEQFHDVNIRLSAITMEGVRTRPSRLPNSRSTTNPQRQLVQNVGPPIPPPNGMTKAAPMKGMYTRHQEAASRAAVYDKQMKVYQVKTRQPQDMPEYGNQ